ncbi:MAG: hypothetical protein HQL72_10180 [Magnetococcales bacterium]|nr:hypothetical protein [Magnetococcales bacterium]
MSVRKSKREREIIQRIDDEIADIRKKTQQFQNDNPISPLNSDVRDLSEKIHSGILPSFKKPTIH